jgi:hypothetical protein
MISSTPALLEIAVMEIAANEQRGLIGISSNRSVILLVISQDTYQDPNLAGERVSWFRWTDEGWAAVTHKSKTVADPPNWAATTIFDLIRDLRLSDIRPIKSGEHADDIARQLQQQLPVDQTSGAMR